MQPEILITGAAGNTGQVIVQELQKRGVPFVVLTHSETNCARLEAKGMHVLLGSFDDPASLERALTGIKTAYLVCTPDEKLIPRETNFINAAKKVGVKHIVKCSAYMAGLNAETQNLRSHGVIEKTLIESGLDYTIIRPHGFMQTFTLFGWDLIQKAGVISLPGGDGAMPLVDVRDVAMIAVKALTEPGHEGKTYDVTGPEALTMYQQAAILTKVLGKKVTYLPSDEKQLMQVMSLLGVPETPAEHTIKIFRLQRAHKINKVHTTLHDLGIKPHTYEEFLHDYIAGVTTGGNSFQPPETLLIKVVNAVTPPMFRFRVWMSERSKG